VEVTLAHEAERGCLTWKSGEVWMNGGRLDIASGWEEQDGTIMAGSHLLHHAHAWCTFISPPSPHTSSSFSRSKVDN
jgi:hypothetical protein